MAFLESEHRSIVPEAPKRIKPQEVGKYNPVWMDITQLDKDEFAPIPNDDTFRYLWVLKGESVILGIEFDDIATVKRVLKSYGIDETYIDGLSDKELAQFVGLGHPTLSAHFSGSGPQVKYDDALKPTFKLGDIHEAASSNIGLGGAQFDKSSFTGFGATKSYGSALVGGEMNWKSGGWKINNASGRHSGGKAFTNGEKLQESDWRLVLGKVKSIIKRYLDLDVEIGSIKVK